MKIHYTSTLLFITLLGFSLFSKEKDYTVSAERVLHEESAVPNFIQFEENNLPDIEQLDQVLSKYISDKEKLSYKLLKTEKDDLGEVHYRYQQTFKSIPIAFAEFKVHTRTSKILSINGNLINEYPSIEAASLSEPLALESALDKIGATSYKWEVKEEETYLKLMENDPNATYFPKGDLVYVTKGTSISAKKLRLAYVFNIYAHDPMSRNEIYIDATNGELLFKNNLIHTANVPGTAVTAYSGTQTINVDSISSNQFRLRQTVYGNGVNTFDMNGGSNYGAAADFTDTDNFWNNTNAQLDQYATDAHWGAEQTYDYFFTEHNRNSINNAGFALNSYIHYLPPNANNYVNAFWDGQRMTYGDGGNGVSPLVALDIAGHEIAHGLTTFSANLVYASESGALNESFSDIFGTAIEFYARPANANWTVGEDINLTLRSMSNPGLYGDPDTRNGANWRNVIGCVPSNANDQCGVHSNSGVQNFWFYLLSQGGSGTNDLSNAYNVTGIGVQKAAKVAFRNLTVYLNRSSNYDDARFFAIQSAIDLYGPCSPEVESVTNAWYAVGVGNAYVAGVQSDFTSSANSSCQPPFDVTFQNQSNNGSSFFWDFGDGSTSTARVPTHTYNSFGNFDVKLVADGGSCGIDSLTKSGEINIDTANACVVLLNDGFNATQLDCRGKLFDSGGGANNYFPNQNGIITISPQGASSITLTILSFDVEAGVTAANCNYDYLAFYDGASTAAPSLGVFCNNSATQIPSTITSTGGDLTIQFISDGGLERPGFEIDWNCNYPTTAPSTDFSVSADSSCTGLVEFQDKSTNAPNSWLWDFGDGNSSIQENPVHTYTVNGNYNVKLKSTNSFGSDSIVKTSVIAINRPTQPLTGNDTICANQSATLTAFGQGTLNWFANEIGGNAVFSGSNYTTSALINDTSFWVEDFILKPTFSGGPTSNNIGGGGNFNLDRALVFDVFSKIVLTDVFVYTASSGTRVFELRDAQGNVLQTHSQFLSNGLANVDLDFTIEAGTNYQLGVNDNALVDLYRNNSGVNYPYAISNLVSIKSSTAQTNPQNFYYFFYFWRVKELDCASPRTEVKAVIDPNCTLTGLGSNELERIELQIFPNPTTSTLNVIIPEQVEKGVLRILDIKGRLAKEITLGGKRTFSIENNELRNGVYFLQLTSSKKVITKKFIINR